MIKHKNQTIIFLALLALMHHCLLSDNIEKLVPDTPPHEDWLNVFIHGTEAASLACVSFFKVAYGRTNGTLYQVLQKGVRNNPSAHKYQLMSELGLERVDIFGGIQTNNRTIVPTIKAYELLNHNLLPSQKHEYYLFGWDGIWSHKARQQAAADLHTTLQAELTLYHNRGITPKVRLIGFSHGGNVALNLAAFSQLEIDELVMYGTPIQAETEAFCFSPIFKKVINVYSECDKTQSLDWISTKKRKCSQRIKIPQQHQDAPLNKVIQVKIMINHTSIKKNRAKNHRCDPTHRDFWFLNKKKSPCTFFDPLPLATYTPLFLTAINQATNNDLALLCTVHQDTQSVIFNVYKHSQQTPDAMCTYQLPLATLENIKQEAFT